MPRKRIIRKEQPLTRIHGRKTHEQSYHMVLFIIWKKKSLTLVLERKEDYARTVTSENSLNFHPCYISEKKKSDDANHKKSGKS